MSLLIGTVSHTSDVPHESLVFKTQSVPPFHSNLFQFTGLKTKIKDGLCFTGEKTEIFQWR